MPLYREDLEGRSCNVPDCRHDAYSGEVTFHPGCHLDSPLCVRYRADVLTLSCATCGRPVASVVIASRASETLDLGH